VTLYLSKVLSGLASRDAVLYGAVTAALDVDKQGKLHHIAAAAQAQQQQGTRP
jgi:hypothetical protein